MTYLVDTSRKVIFGPYTKDFTLVVNYVGNDILEVEVWHIPTANRIYVHEFSELTVEPDIDFSEEVWEDFDHAGKDRQEQPVPNEA